MTSVTSEYIAGIKEGRSLLNANPETTEVEMKMHVITLNAMLKSGYSKPMKDLFKGERDFWRNQIKKGIK